MKLNDRFPGERAQLSPCARPTRNAAPNDALGARALRDHKLMTTIRPTSRPAFLADPRPRFGGGQGALMPSGRQVSAAMSRDR